uniref:Uncharacterized protein n=1 Tax=Chromera velia CCMP2878 TaxID=1169474 RepID=A0A0G4IF12_9ALVE|eukprot:Cvel_13830.t1-p1 / transcript=Cvel_13830.t1 / gene=Cvel_13830 / organism=Chromera_velia_CCMP2878 / gene_product=Zinc finger protein 283, putative / transcript_product=Zinc finger protein 283, putative / location=Cvel_scaffold960:29116-31431(+) / protein_length=772 / sequence_SO=supercontig / SO=protein_coding / is_pseudo=false
MVETARGGVVLFACTGVEPREGQRLIVVGSSSELGEGNASRGIPLHRVKNPAFPGVWMSFPMRHSACSHLRFQFALASPGADTLEWSVSACGGANSGATLTDAHQQSSAVASSLTPEAAPTYNRSEDCCGCVWEPLGCGVREVGVVDGGLVLFGGRWGERETQVTPLTWEDIVLAQQQLEEETSPAVSSELDTEKESEQEGRQGSENKSVTAISQSSSMCASSKREGGKGEEKGCGVAAQSEGDFAVSRGGQEGGGRVRLQQVDIDMSLYDSAETEGISLSGGHVKTSLSPVLQKKKRGNEVMGERERDEKSDQVLRFGPAALNERGWVRGEEGDRLGGKGAESVNGLRGTGCPGLFLGESRGAEGEPLCPSAVCEGPKRRRLSLISPAVSDSQYDMIGSEEALVTGEGVAVFPFASVAQQQSFLPSQKRSLSRGTFTHCLEVQSTAVPRERQAVCGLSEGGMERALTTGEKTGDVWQHSVGREGSTGCLGGCEKRGGKGKGRAPRRGEEGQIPNCPLSARAGGFVVDAGSVGERACVSTAGNETSARIVEGRASVSMAAFARSARSAEGGAFVGTAGSALDVETVEGATSVCTADGVIGARSVEVVAFVSTVGSVISARSAAGRVFVSTVDGARSARSAEGRVSVSTAGSVAIVGIVEGRVSVSTVAFVVDAKIVEGRASVNTAGSEISARTVGGRVSVNTAGSVAIVGIVEGRASVSTVGSETSARSAGERASVSIGRTPDTARNASSSLLFLLDLFSHPFSLFAIDLCP